MYTSAIFYDKLLLTKSGHIKSHFSGNVTMLVLCNDIEVRQ